MFSHLQCIQKTYLHHIPAVLTRYTYTVPLVGLGDLLWQCFPASTNKFDISIMFTMYVWCRYMYAKTYTITQRGPLISPFIIQYKQE